MEETQKKHYELELKISLQEQKIVDLEKENGRLYETLKGFVTLARYRPLEKVVFGGVGLILVGVVTALLALVLK